MDSKLVCAPFTVKTCSLAVLATGQKACSLVELRDKIISIDQSSIHYHFWGSHLNSKLAYSHYHNDFSHWIYQHLHDETLAEQLSIIDPNEFANLEELREAVIETIEKRLDDYQIIEWAKREDCFHFMQANTTVFESTVSIASPEDLPHAIRYLPPSSIFYHFIDAKTRTKNSTDDFSEWLSTWNDDYTQLIEDIQSIDFYFLTLVETREKLVEVTKNYFSTKEKQ